MKSPLTFIVETKWTAAEEKLSRKAVDLVFND